MPPTAATTPSFPARLPLRTRVATRAMLAVNAVSRRAGRGAGTVVGGRVGLAVDPRLLERLCAGRRMVLVSGTNGKTTTTACLAAALRATGAVATNATGSNMPPGHAAALGASPSAPTAVLECDEVWLPKVLPLERPAAVVLLNLSRDQLDRTAEVRQVAQRWRAALERFDGLVVANADDPLVVHAASAAPTVAWYAGGASGLDAATCAGCGERLALDGVGWSCTCGRVRPAPDATPGVASVLLDGATVPFALRLPGAFNLANATAALLAAARLGVDPTAAAAAICDVRSVAGRFATVRLGDAELRLMLAKNPAGWAALLDLLAGDEVPVVLAVNARDADGHDPSWLYDVEFERLAGRVVVATGERSLDLGTRLGYGDVAHRTVDAVDAALLEATRGHRRVDVIANYTAFASIAGSFGVQT